MIEDKNEDEDEDERILRGREKSSRARDAEAYGSRAARSRWEESQIPRNKVRDIERDRRGKRRIRARAAGRYDRRCDKRGIGGERLVANEPGRRREMREINNRRREREREQGAGREIVDKSVAEEIARNAQKLAAYYYKGGQTTNNIIIITRRIVLRDK